MTPPPSRNRRHLEDADSTALLNDRGLHNRRRRSSCRDSFDEPDSPRDHGISVRNESRRDVGEHDRNKTMLSSWPIGRAPGDGSRVAEMENDQPPSVYSGSGDDRSSSRRINGADRGTPRKFSGEDTESVAATEAKRGDRSSVKRGGSTNHSREFITPANRKESTDSSSGNESSIKTWFPGARWSRNSLRAQRRKGKARGKKKSGVGRSGARAIIQTGSPPSPADILSSAKMRASTAARPDHTIAATTGPPRLSQNTEPSFLAAGSTGGRPAFEKLRGGSNDRRGGRGIKEAPTSATSRQTLADLASTTKIPWDLRTPSGTTAATSAAETSFGSAVSATAASMKPSPSSVSVSNGRGARPGMLRSEAGASARNMAGGGRDGGQGLGNPFNALASFNRMPAKSQTTTAAAVNRMRLAPADGQGRGARVKDAGGAKGDSSSEDSAAASNNGESPTTKTGSDIDALGATGGITGNEMATTDQEVLPATEMTLAVVRGAASSDGRVKRGFVAGQGRSSITVSKAGAQSRRTVSFWHH